MGLRAFGFVALLGKVSAGFGLDSLDGVMQCCGGGRAWPKLGTLLHSRCKDVRRLCQTQTTTSCRHLVDLHDLQVPSKILPIQGTNHLVTSSTCSRQLQA